MYIKGKVDSKCIKVVYYLILFFGCITIKNVIGSVVTICLLKSYGLRSLLGACRLFVLTWASVPSLIFVHCFFHIPFFPFLPVDRF